MFRYFFKLFLIDHNGAVDLDDDEDEELQWESSNEQTNPQALPNSLAVSDISPENDSQNQRLHFIESELSHSQTDLVKENETLKSQVRALVNRISELEKLIAGKDETISSLELRLSLQSPVSLPSCALNTPLITESNLPDRMGNDKQSLEGGSSLDLKSECNGVVLVNHPAQGSNGSGNVALGSEQKQSPWTKIVASTSLPQSKKNKEKICESMHQTKSTSASVVALEDDEDDGWT